jgi:hypothetical protein
LDAIALDHFDIKTQRAKIPDCVSCARKQNPRLWNGRVIDIDVVPTLRVVHSARKGDITHNKSVRKINPDVVEFADGDSRRQTARVNAKNYWKLWQCLRRNCPNSDWFEAIVLIN